MDSMLANARELKLSINNMKYEVESVKKRIKYLTEQAIPIAEKEYKEQVKKIFALWEKEYND